MITSSAATNKWEARNLEELQAEVTEIQSRLTELSKEINSIEPENIDKLYFGDDVRVQTISDGINIVSTSSPIFRVARQGDPLTTVIADEFYINSTLRGGIGHIDPDVIYAFNNVGGGTLRGYIRNSAGIQKHAYNFTENGCRLHNIPTSSAGLSSGDLWNDSGTLKIIT